MCGDLVPVGYASGDWLRTCWRHVNASHGAYRGLLREKLLSWSHQWGNVSFVEEANENPDASFDSGWCEPGKEL